MAGSSNAIKMGRAFVEFFVEDNAAYRQLDKIGGRFKSVGGNLQKTGGMLGAGGSALLAPLLASLKEVIGRANDLTQLTDRIGGTVSGLSQLTGGAERAGLTAEEFGNQLQGLRVKAEEAADANGYLDDQMKSLGRGADLARLGHRELLETIAEYVRRIPGAVNQLRALQKLGLDQRLLPHMKRGRQGVADLFKAGGPGAMTDEQGRQAVAVTNAARVAWNDFKDTVRQVGLSLLPTAARMAELKERVASGLMAVREWIKENRGAIVTTAAVGAGLVAAGVLVTGVGITFVVVGKAILLTLAAVKAAFAVLFSPFILGAGLAAGAMYLFATRTETGRQATASLNEQLGAVAGRAKAAFGGIAGAVGNGDWTRAFKIGLAYLKAEWATFNLYLTVGWNTLKGVFVDTWHGIVAGLKLAFNELGAFILQATVGRLRTALEMAAAAVESAVPGIAGRKLARGIRAGAGAIMSAGDIEAGRKGNQDRILNAEQNRKRAADADRDRSNMDAGRAEASARHDLAELLRSGGGGMGGFSELLAGIGEGIGNSLRGAAAGFHGPTRLADAVKGVTGSHAAIGQQLAFGDSIPQRQLDAAEATRDVLAANLPQMGRDIGLLAQSGRVQ